MALSIGAGLLAAAFVFTFIKRKLTTPATTLGSMEFIVTAGASISEVIAEMVESADECNCAVSVEFNGVRVTALPGEGTRRVFSSYTLAHEIQMAEYEAQEAKRKQEAKS